MKALKHKSIKNVLFHSYDMPQKICIKKMKNTTNKYF